MLEDIEFATEWGSRDLHSDPTKYGIEQVAILEEEPNYSFNMCVIWRRKEDGELRWGADSGCSCPSPFQDTKNWFSLDKLPETREALELHAHGMSVGAADRVEFLKQVHELCG